MLVTDSDEPDVPNENTLIAAAKSGDKRAFRVIVDRYQATVLRLAYRITGDRDAAADVAQETFVRAWQHLPGFEPKRPGSLRAWLCRIAHNQALDVERRAETISLTERHPDPGPSPFESVETSQTGRLVQEAVLRLPDHCRGALVLREFEGLTYREIAEVLDVPIGTVMSRLHDARRRLAADLRPQIETGASK